MNAPPRASLSTLLGDLERLELILGGWEEATRSGALAYGRALEALNAEALRRLLQALKAEPRALEALRAAAADEVVYAVLRRHQLLKASLTERVEAALASVRPMLASHGGDVELEAVAPPTISVRFLGACDGCPASALTFHEGVKKAVEAACPEITEVRQVRGGGHGAPARAPGADPVVSPFAAEAGWEPVADLEEVPEGGLRAVELKGQPLLLARRGGQVTCFENRCAHLGLPLDGGEVKEGVLTCPHHGFRYDLVTGECLTAPTVQLTARPVRLSGARVHVRLEG